VDFTSLGSQKGNLKLVELLLNYNPYLDAQELAEGWTPLMVSVVNDFNSIFLLLIQSGADKFLKDKSGKNVYDLAQKYKSINILKLLA
jgi:ankyrin repeat protein